jgi:hypothetical protein
MSDGGGRRVLLPYDYLVHDGLGKLPNIRAASDSLTLTDASKIGMCAAMTCPKYLALRDAYEQTLRYWVDATRLPNSGEGNGETKLLAFAGEKCGTGGNEFTPGVLRDMS